MNISRRSFLKMAGLTTVAAAGAAMFTGCGLDMVTVNMVIVDDSKSLGWTDNKQEGSTKLFAFMVKDTVKVSDVQKAIDTMLKASGAGDKKITIVTKDNANTIPVTKYEDGSFTIEIHITVKSDKE